MRECVRVYAWVCTVKEEVRGTIKEKRNAGGNDIKKCIKQKNKKEIYIYVYRADDSGSLMHMLPTITPHAVIWVSIPFTAWISAALCISV
jgi:hypothetical protein